MGPSGDTDSDAAALNSVVVSCRTKVNRILGVGPSPEVAAWKAQDPRLASLLTNEHLARPWVTRAERLQRILEAISAGRSVEATPENLSALEAAETMVWSAVSDLHLDPNPTASVAAELRLLEVYAARLRALRDAIVIQRDPRLNLRRLRWHAPFRVRSVRLTADSVSVPTWKGRREIPRASIKRIIRVTDGPAWRSGQRWRSPPRLLFLDSNGRALGRAVMEAVPEEDIDAFVRALGVPQVHERAWNAKELYATYPELMGWRDWAEMHPAKAALLVYAAALIPVIVCVVLSLALGWPQTRG